LTIGQSKWGQFKKGESTMATKSVKVNPVDQKPDTNLQIIASVEAGAPVFEPHKNQAERVKIAKGTALEVLDPPIHSGAGGAQYYYITDSTKNGNFRRYFIRAQDVQ
jgi:hypothetical protein